jgi:hypothetical protein
MGEQDVSVVTLRPVEDSDLDALFDQMRDPESVNRDVVRRWAEPRNRGSHPPAGHLTVSGDVDLAPTACSNLWSTRPLVRFRVR